MGGVHRQVREHERHDSQRRRANCDVDQGSQRRSSTISSSGCGQRGQLEDFLQGRARQFLWLLAVEKCLEGSRHDGRRSTERQGQRKAALETQADRGRRQRQLERELQRCLQGQGQERLQRRRQEQEVRRQLSMVWPLRSQRNRLLEQVEGRSQGSQEGCGSNG